MPSSRLLQLNTIQDADSYIDSARTDVSRSSSSQTSKYETIIELLIEIFIFLDMGIPPNEMDPSNLSNRILSRQFNNSCKYLC